MKEADHRSAVKNPAILDRQKIDLAAVRYSLQSSRPETKFRIQAPQLEGAKRDRKY